MSQEIKRLIVHDMAFCEAMIEDMEAYLKSKVLFWEPNRGRVGGEVLSKLTFGRLLLAQRRLETLRERLNRAQEQMLAQVVQMLALNKRHWRSSYQDKLARDLRSCLNSWAWYLDDFERLEETPPAHYARQVENRVKAELLLQEVADIDLVVQKSRQRQRVLDAQLRADFVKGDFCWPAPLAPGFPQERFWYLWGRLEKEQD